MDEQTLHDDLVAISTWVDPVVAPDTEHLDAHGVVHDEITGRRGVPWQRTLLAAAAVLLVIGGVWVLTGRDDTDQTVAPTPTTTPTGPDVGGDAWKEVPPAPLQPRAEAQVQWTGTEFVVFAGTDQAPCPVCDYAGYGDTLHDAAAYDPATNTWRSIADLPDVSSYLGTSAVVDGDVYWMSVRDPNTNANGIDATLQKWSSADDTWTEVALPTEVPSNPKLTAVGRGLLLYPGTDEVGAFPDQLFDGTSWTSLPDDPITQAFDRQYLLVDGTLTLFARDLHTAQQTASPSVVVAASYDPATSTWTRLADSDQLTPPVVTLGSTAYAPLGGGEDGAQVANWGRLVPNGGSYSAGDGWLPLPAPAPDDLMGVVSIDGAAVLGVKGHVMQVADGTYQAIPALPDGLGDQFGQAIANGADLVFTFGGGLGGAGGAAGSQGVHARGFVWRPFVVTGAQTTLQAVIRNLGIDPSRAPAGALDLAGGTFCGDEIPDPVDGSIGSTDGRTCFAAALAERRTATYIMQVSTVEGDPIAYVWHTGPDGDSEYIDSTRDTFGSGEWSQRQCVLSPTGNTPPFVCVDEGIDVNPTTTG